MPRAGGRRGREGGRAGSGRAGGEVLVSSEDVVEPPAEKVQIACKAGAH